MQKTLLLAFILFSFGGCADKEHIYVEAQCPKIETLEPVEPIDINVSVRPWVTGGVFCISGRKEDGFICGKSAREIFDWMKQIRKSEVYYIDELKKYNEKFTVYRLDAK